MPPTTIILSTTLHFLEGRSDKVYQATIEEHAPEGFPVTFAYRCLWPAHSRW